MEKGRTRKEKQIWKKMPRQGEKGTRKEKGKQREKGEGLINRKGKKKKDEWKGKGKQEKTLGETRQKD